jgi:hypothetical protein
MPLLITPAQPFTTAHALPAPSVYAIILIETYDTRRRLLSFEVGYFASEQAYAEARHPLPIAALPTGFVQGATVDALRQVDPFVFMEQLITTQLTALLGPGVQIQNVP